MLLLPVGVCALAAHLVSASKLAVICREHHNRRTVQGISFQLFEQPNQITVAVANAVEVVVLQDPPPTVFVGPLTEQSVLTGLVFVMGARPARRVEWLMARRRQRHVPLREVSLATRRPVYRVGGILALHRLVRRVRID